MQQILTSTFLFCLACLTQLLNEVTVHAQTPTQPNVIFILTDDLGYSDISCYGAEKVNTPNIDQLAIDGIKSKQMERDIPMEICDKLGSDWGWHSNYKSRGLNFLRSSLAHAAYWDANLLINTGPKPDGSLFDGDVQAIKKNGARTNRQRLSQTKKLHQPHASKTA